MKNADLGLCSSKTRPMSTFRGMKGQPHAFLTLTLDGNEWSDSCIIRFTPRKGTLLRFIWYEPSWHRKPVWTWRREKSLPLSEI